MQHARIAARHPTLVRVLPDLPLAAVDAWLVMHEDLRSSPAVRTVFTALFAYLQLETEQSPGRKRERERA